MTNNHIITNTEITFTYIPPGHFSMGSPKSEKTHRINEFPVHDIFITKGFHITIYPITQKQYSTIMGKNPSYFCSCGKGIELVKNIDTSNFPVESVTWYDACLFCEKITKLAPNQNFIYRLPTEAEWEYCCRANTRYAFNTGNQHNAEMSNINPSYPYNTAAKGIYLKRTCAVGQYPPNKHGLYDMHGNIWEWCSDYYLDNYYSLSKHIDPTGPANGFAKVYRGGAWNCYSRFCRSGYRGFGDPNNGFYDLGFRVIAEKK